MRIVQLMNTRYGRRVAVVQEPDLLLVHGFESVYALAVASLDQGTSLENLIRESTSHERLPYDEVYAGTSDWQLLPAADHPLDPRFCMVSGTGLTHQASAENRQKMHDAQAESQLTDSMKIYQWGVEGGKPAPGQIGTQPEWFYKGNGSVLKAHNATLKVPCYGQDGGEEPELAAIYLNSREGTPYRLGFATANEFSDHIMEKQNYLYLAPSKIRNCAIGPELVLTDAIADLSGQVAIERNGQTLWEKAIKTGENNMAHSLQNLEYHHFKYPNHRLPLDLHVHFLGADAFSFGENIALRAQDVMMVQWEGMGRALRNTLAVDTQPEVPIQIRKL
ncbi:GguC family protein [Rhabdobacter roseus]|uniref:GguC protein n=1 Tax=Rhabdobacter roseus TaxID=1655419 RepID=A0A840U267_9BACT|nr:AraD1 family protein [Rhabdobacter roseus]MBB5286458.1 hypothetical protein [Rhabdobacter roseus]